MPYAGVLFGLLKAFALYRFDMKDSRSFHVFYVIERLHEALYIVPVNRPEISDVETFEDVLIAAHQGLYAVVETHDYAPAAFRYPAETPKATVGFVAHIIIFARGVYAREVFVQSPHIGVNAHVIVVEDYQQIVAALRGIVQAFESQPAAD